MKLLHASKKMAVTAIFLLISALTSPLLAPAAYGQATQGGIRGVVTDSTGAIIADADVTARNMDTGVETKVKTNAEGLYTMPKLLPGRYLLSVEKQNFKKAEFQEVGVTVGQDTVIDATLQAGQVTEVVTVTASGEELIQKEQVQISNTFQSRKVADLPANVAGGGIDVLALLAPGVVPGLGFSNSNGAEFSVNGNRARSNNFNIDGQDNNDLSVAGPSYFVDNQDTVAEFQLITNNFSAEYGRNQGAIVNIITKSGTNDFHGTGFWFHRDRKLFDSLNNIERRRGDEDPPPFLYNVYGGTAGGPIIKDRAFFFGSYQLITGRSESIFTSDAPTIAPEELSRLRAAFPGNAAVATLANFSAFAITNIGSVSERADRPHNETVTIGGQVFRVAYPQRSVRQPFNAHEFTARGDFKINDRNSVWYRELFQNADNKNALVSPGSGGFVSDIPTKTNSGGLQFTTQISNTAVNEFRFSFTKLSVTFGGGCDSSVPGCIPDPADIGSTLANISFAGIRSSGGVSLQTIGPATNLPQGRTVRTFQFSDNFSKTFGRHQLKMGADIRRIKNDNAFLPNVNGSFTFNTANALVQNRPVSVNLATGEVNITYNETDQFYYFQDDWRIKDNLTLNLGIRYEYTGQPLNTLHQITLDRESDPSTALFRQSLPIDVRTFPEIPADKNNWAPRIGFAYRPRFGASRWNRMLFGDQDSTVISGGYSIAYDPVFYNILSNISSSAPLVISSTIANPATGAVVFPLPAIPTGSAVQGFATANNLVALNVFDPRLLNRTTVAPNFHSPYAQQWSLRVQREIARNNVVEARYVGTHGVGLFQTINGNPQISRLVNGFTLGGFTFPGFPNLVPAGVTPVTCVNNPATPDNEAACNGRIRPGEGLIRSRENTAQSIYHALQTRYEGRLWNNLSVGMSYTFSKALDNASEIFTSNESAVAQNPFDTSRLERSYSGFDRRHVYSLNFIWDIPFFKEGNGFIGRALGGWQFNGTYFLASGQRFTPTQIFNSLFINSGYEDVAFSRGFLGGIDNFRPFVGNIDAPRDAVGISQIDAALAFGVDVINPNGFYSLNELNTTGNAVTVTKDQVRYIVNGPGAATIFGNPYGTAARNSELGPKLNNLNLGLFKNFKITEKVRLQFRAEMFNALNHPNTGVGFITADAVPDIVVEDAGSTFNRRDEMTFARRGVQFGAKIIF
jgi:outer membrane receptor protein involved in Fe transport